ncbi:hypothetical protein FQR65_LT08165 [Abscondita terminalis]|nr:hypothetical protein FQR65_LT08165 [Abscondita terminalis]
MGTGGGPSPNIKKDVTHDLIFSIINEKTVYGLSNQFDSDEIELQEQNSGNDCTFELQTDNVIVNEPMIKTRGIKRKRPATVVRALASSHIAQRYEELIERRLHISHCIENEFKEKTAEHLKRMESLDLEIALKKQQLNNYI